MTNYKELADHLEAYFKNGHRMDEVIAILRRLDAAQVAVDQVMVLAHKWKDLYEYDKDNPLIGKTWHSTQAEEDLRAAVEALALGGYSDLPPAPKEPT